MACLRNCSELALLGPRATSFVTFATNPCVTEVTDVINRRMPFARIGTLRIAYETFGNRSGPPVMLIMGLGSQMMGWRTGFCERLAAKGFFVVRFDNRDIGLSSRVPVRATPLRTLAERRVGRRVSPPYRLRDMADDVIGLMDLLQLSRAHLLGASMGGMIAQLCAANYPERVLSLTSLMSTTSDQDLPGPDWRLRYQYFRRAPRDPEAQVDRLVGITRLVGSRDHFDEVDIRQYFETVVARSADRSGVPRQLTALLAEDSRAPSLSRLSLPTLVLHGMQDPILPPAHGLRTAETIPGARLHLIPSLGHDLPRALWGELSRPIVEHLERASEAGSQTAPWKVSRPSSQADWSKARRRPPAV